MAGKKNDLAEPEESYFAGTQADSPDGDFGFLEPVERKPITDPTMDPGDPRWLPKKYFDAQEKIIIVLNKNESDILSDPKGTRKIVQPVSINGYTLRIQKGVPTKVPRDFAAYLVEIGAASHFGEVAEL